jgi:hypothetical protein
VGQERNLFGQRSVHLVRNQRASLWILCCNKMLQTCVQPIYQRVYEMVTPIPTTVSSVDVHLRMAAFRAKIYRRSLQVHHGTVTHQSMCL